jgi:cystathionine gamma-synthase
MHFDTIALHSGEPLPKAGQPVSPSIVTATSFYTTPDTGFSASDLAIAPDPFYTRWGNPTVAILEQRLASLEGGAGSIVVASGMAAAAALFLPRLRSGDHLILSDICYAGLAEFAAETLPKFGISVSAVDTSQPSAVEAAIRPGVTKLIHIETPANPVLKLSDIEALAVIAHRCDAELSVDSTIATPVATRPLAYGADYVLHSLTKYICGHGDALGGALIAGQAERLLDLRKEALIHHGGAMSPFAAWLILRGLETLSLRMRVHEINAYKIAHFLNHHPAVGVVHWPGLKSHPQASLASRQMRNYSGLLSFTTKQESKSVARRLAQCLKIFSYAVSIGKTKSLLYHIPTEDILRTSFRLDAAGTDAYRSLASDGVFRVSVGLEDSDDLIQDLAQALE